MLTGPLVCLSASLFLWPGSSARPRLAGLDNPLPWQARLRASGLRLAGRRRTAAISTVAGCVAGLWAGPGASVAVLLGCLAIAVHLRSRRRSRDDLRAMTRTAETLRAMAGDLRSGAHPAHAAESAAADADADAARVLSTMATTVRLGGDPALDGHAPGSLLSNDGVPAGAPSNDVGGEGALGRLTTAWALARRHGLPLADVVDAVHRDVDARARMAGQLDARMAGPRASALMLAALPLLGVLLGEAMGAGPLTVLSTTGAGQALLVIGSALLLGGVCWTSAITGRVHPR